MPKKNNRIRLIDKNTYKNKLSTSISKSKQNTCITKKPKKNKTKKNSF